MGSIEKGSEDKYFGGEFVNKLEKNWSKFYNVKHAISVNSWTSGLTVAIGSLNIEPGDEIIVSPWTMCATATSILQWNAKYLYLLTLKRILFVLIQKRLLS